MNIKKHLYKLVVGKPFVLSKDDFKVYAGVNKRVISLDDYLPETKANAYVFEDNQISFNFEFNNNPENNQGYVNIYNPPQDFIEYVVNNKNITIQLMAGNDLTGLKELVTATIVDTNYNPSGNDTSLSLVIADGIVNTRTSLFTGTFPRGTSYNKIITTLANHLQLALGALPKQIERQYLTYPQTFTGNTHNILGKVCASLKCDYSLINGNIYIVPKHAEGSVKRVAKLTYETGLVSSLTRVKSNLKGNSKKEEDYADRWEFSALLDADIKPFTTVFVDDGVKQEALKITRSIFVGDLDAGKWHVLCEGVPVDAQELE